MTAESNYPINAENIAEMARLTRQARQFSLMSGLLPTGLTLPTHAFVLDIASGPGEWVVGLARAHPGFAITGVDISRLMTDYARTLAREQGFSDVHFKIMDVRERLAFPEASFDLVHIRFATLFMSPEGWPKLLAECYRVLKPGGYLLAVEGEGTAVSTSPSLARLISLGQSAMHRAGRYYAPPGEYSGITAVHPRLMREAGLTVENREAFVLDFSTGSPAHVDIVQDWAIAFALGAPFLAQLGVATREEIEMLRNRSIEEMDAPNFSGIWYIQRLTARKGE